MIWTPEAEQELIEVIDTFPSISVKQLCKEFDEAPTSMSRKLNKLGYVRTWFRFDDKELEVKDCRICGPKEEKEFGVRNDSKDGLNYVCKSCNMDNTYKSEGRERKQPKPVPTPTTEMTKQEKTKYWGDKLNEGK